MLQCMPSLLLRGGTVLTAEEGRQPLEDAWVLVEGDTIAAVGEGAAPDADEVIDASDSLVTPGFVNAHTHLCMIYGRTLGADRDLLTWLAEYQVPLMRALEPRDYALSMELGAVENLRSGGTTVCEVFFSPHYEQQVDQHAAQALDRTGIRSVLFRCSNDESFFEGFVESRGQIVDRAEQLIDSLRGNDRTRVGVGPLVPWGSSEGSFRDAVELSTAHDVGLHLHTAETPEYNDLVRERTGLSNVEMLADVGALGPRVMLNHCVHLSDHDVELIAEARSPVIHDPTSNMLLASGVAPVPRLRDAGVTLGLACDGPACNNGQDMIETMKNAALLQKAVTRQPGIVVADQVFRMATHGGAQAVGLGDRLGLVREGYLADLVVIDLRAPHLTPVHDPLAALVYSARGSDVRTVIVGGQVVVRDRSVTTVDEERVCREVSDRARQARATI
jgi:5-methylthioadenosine/S-adenosylhomocysteine deaminase